MLTLIALLGCADTSTPDLRPGLPEGAEPASLELSAPPTISGTEDQKFIPSDAVQYGFAGLAVASVGDLDSDGYDDVAVYAEKWDGATHTSPGAVYLLYGSVSGLVGEQRLDPSDPADYGRFGRSIASAGDVNGDGYVDLLVGSAGDWSSSSEAEPSLYVYLGSASGLDTSTEQQLIPTGVVEGSNFGEEVRGVGDLNGDGYDDIVGGTSYGLDNSTYGDVVIYYGSASGADASSEQQFRASDTSAAYWLFGCAVAGPADLDQDGYDDLIVGAYAAEGLTSSTGAVYAYSGSATGVDESSEQKIYASDGVARDRFGNDLTTAGDLDQDGHPDIVVGAHRAVVSGLSDAGAVYLYYGSVSGLDASREDKLTSPTPTEREYFGELLTRGGDLDADGFPDLLVSSPAADMATSSGGGAWILFGDGAGLDTSSALTLVPSDNQSSDYFGISIAADMDVNADGYGDLIAGAYGDDDAASRSGAAYLYLGACRDGDGDGVCAAEDCDDDDSGVGAASDLFYVDLDGDGYGDPAAETVTACEAPEGYVDDDNDCDDTSADIRPGGEELCGGVDEDCDGQLDEADAVDAPTWYGDGDGDGYGTPDATTRACTRPSSYVDNADDCDDGRASVNPEAQERCDDEDVDEDCDGASDDEDDDATGGTPWYADADGDGYGSAVSLGEACEPPEGAVADDSDCDDSDPSSYPGAPEVEDDGVDQDCDGEDAEGVGGDDSSADPDDTGAVGEDKDGGCSTAPAPRAGLLLALGLLLWRRRALASAPRLR